jgi:hypothetical protein
VAAKSDLGELFDGKQYDRIKTTSPDVIYQLYLLSSVLDQSVYGLSTSKQYIANLAGYMRFTLFALVVRALQAANAEWGSPELSKTLQDAVKDPPVSWRRFAKQAIDHVYGAYRKDAKRYRRAQGQILSFANYFKSRTYAKGIFGKALPRALSALARVLL